MLISLRSLIGTKPAPTCPTTGRIGSRNPIAARIVRTPSSFTPAPRHPLRRPGNGWARSQKTPNNPASTIAAASTPRAGIVSAARNVATASPIIISRWSSAQAIRSR